MNLYRALLALTRMHADPSPLKRVLESLSAAVRESGIAIHDAGQSGVDDYIAAVTDDECDVIESLLGAAFVTTQAEITGVVSAIMRLHVRAKGSGHVLTTTDGSRKAILAFGSAAVAPSTYSHVQVIDAFANYFKHCDEWRGRWSTATGQARRTIDIISAVGAEENNTGTLRRGAKALGNPDFECLDTLSALVASWATSLSDAYEVELKAIKLV